jgi:hypothetical protein
MAISSTADVCERDADDERDRGRQPPKADVRRPGDFS